jgi:gluconokinase
MRAGHPLDDDDRWPWLDRVAEALNERSAGGGGGVVLACSALKRSYRDRLRAGTGGAVRFAFLDVDAAEIERRLKKRLHHFMPPGLLRSQFDALERPTADELDVVTVQDHSSAEATVAEIARRFGR